jgi:hypothetical protein
MKNFSVQFCLQNFMSLLVLMRAELVAYQGKSRRLLHFFCCTNKNMNSMQIGDVEEVASPRS